MAVQVGFATGLYSGDRQKETDHTRPIEGSEHLATHFRRHDKKAHRQQFNFGETPDLLLQPHSLLKVGMLS